VKTKHAFVELAEAQQEARTSYCGGLDPHLFNSPEENVGVYGKVWGGEAFRMYSQLAKFMGLEGDERRKYACLLAAVEEYTLRVILTLVEECNVRVFKPQAAFYEQFGPAGLFLLQRVRNYIKQLEEEKGIRLICLLDCKRGDIATTQAAYFTGLLGNLEHALGFAFSPFGFDIINVTPWMGEDVLVLKDEKGNPQLGLDLLRAGKGIITVNKSSNPSWERYQSLVSNRPDGPGPAEAPLFIHHAADLMVLDIEHDLECSGLSALGMVVGSTNVCDGNIREVFPGATLLVPGFGAQGGKFDRIMLELIRDQDGDRARWNGQGAIFSSSRGTMYPWMDKFNGSGEVGNLESDLVDAVERFREAEAVAYEEVPVRDAGIRYPYAT